MNTQGFEANGNGGEGEWAMEPAHPRFAAHFTDPMYNDPADEWAPFGSDEAADVLAEWEERRDALTSSTRLRDMYDSEEEWRESVNEIGTSPLDTDDEVELVYAGLMENERGAQASAAHWEAKNLSDDDIADLGYGPEGDAADERTA